MPEKRPAQILKKLLEAGFEAWYVGGCVRDTLLGRPLHDWDITTSARPEQIMNCFSHCVPTGIRHGTITVLEDDVSAEVTTYRYDGKYADGRHPEQVMFVSSLQEDLSRRDFTVNAMAMDDAGRVVDLFCGRKDLAQKRIRCVGDPDVRFQEDALRILRALRFSAQLEFSIEEKTMDAIRRCAHLCDALSVERVRDEVEKILLSPNPVYLETVIGLGLLRAYSLTEIRPCGWISQLPRNRLLRWTAFCRVYPELDLMALRLEKKTAMDAMAVGRCMLPSDTLSWKKMIAEQGAQRACLAAELCGQAELVEQLLNSGDCLTLRQLAVCGDDLPQLQGRAVGACLHSLLFHVLQYPKDNRRDVLLHLADCWENNNKNVY